MMYFGRRREVRRVSWNLNGRGAEESKFGSFKKLRKCEFRAERESGGSKFSPVVLERESLPSLSPRPRQGEVRNDFAHVLAPLSRLRVPGQN